jgi:hypothetical protein
MRTVDRTVIETRSDYAGDREIDELVREAMTDWWVHTQGEDEVAAHIRRAGPATLQGFSQAEIKRWLREKGVPDADQIVQRLLQLDDDQALRIEQANGRIRIVPTSADELKAKSITVTGTDTGLHQDRTQRPLTPDEIVEAAGGPLPPQERTKCPRCDATISVKASRCEWCGTWFSDRDKSYEPLAGATPAPLSSIDSKEPLVSGTVFTRLERSLFTGALFFLTYGTIAVYAHRTAFKYLITYLLALGPGALTLLGSSSGVSEMRAGHLPLGVLVMNGLFYYLIGALSALAMRRRWLLFLLWVLTACTGAGIAWLTLIVTD